MIDPNYLARLLWQYDMDATYGYEPKASLVITDEAFRKHLLAPHYGECIGTQGQCFCCWTEARKLEAAKIAKRIAGKHPTELQLAMTLGQVTGWPNTWNGESRLTGKARWLSG